MPEKLDDDDQAEGEKIRLEDVDNDVEDTEDGGAAASGRGYAEGGQAASKKKKQSRPRHRRRNPSRSA